MTPEQKEALEYMNFYNIGAIYVPVRGWVFISTIRESPIVAHEVLNFVEALKKNGLRPVQEVTCELCGSSVDVGITNGKLLCRGCLGA